jgi:hypothetical protein
MGRRLSAEQLRRFALAKRRLGKDNSSLPPERQLSADQIEKFVRHELDSGNVNEFGYIVKIGEG